MKPANIFVRANDDIVLGDFGAAALMDAKGRVEVAGDPRVRAPETYSAGRQGVPADIYGAAVSLFVALTGRWPFDQATQADLDAAIRAGDRPSLRDLAPHASLALSRVVEQGMHVDPLRRFSTAAEFDSALGKLPARINRFTPIAAHPNHERCWLVDGKSHLHVCVQPGTPRLIAVTHAVSGRRVARLCVTCRPERIEACLRKIFDELRKG